MSNILFILIAAGVGLPVISLAVEALRRSPSPPSQLRWAPDIPIQYVEVNGIRLRYIKTGQGPALVLLHTLRTQLDLFEKVVPKLAGDFTVYALDLPGHGYSDIPDAKYDAAFFADAVEGCLEVLDLNDVMLAGVSIGGALPLIVAARHNPRVTRAVAINPYDYAQGRGMARSSPLARLVVATADIPVLGETVMRLRSFFIMKNVLEGGVSNPRHISPPLLKEMYLTGNRKGHYRAFISLLRNSESWQLATKDYAHIRIPVLFLWGNQDWARPDEREHDRQLVPGADMVTVEDAGHFMPLDRPDEVIRHLHEFYRRYPALSPADNH
ncbi:MAG: alpha/beta hydrolase [Methylobacter sp.]|nr:alpha/beta hydrolase [Methylobacter sp.]